MKNQIPEHELLFDEICNKLKAFDEINVNKIDLSEEVQQLSDQLEQERQANAKISSDLAKSLELNLKLQFEIEDVRSRATQALNEERKHNSYLTEKTKSLSNELELSQTLNIEVRSELTKAKDNFQSSIAAMESHSHKQNEIIGNLTLVAEKKMVELKLALDKKTIECQDYYSHLQKALTNLSVLKQENAALKEYVEKISKLPTRTAIEAPSPALDS